MIMMKPYFICLVAVAISTSILWQKVHAGFNSGLVGPIDLSLNKLRAVQMPHEPLVPAQFESAATYTQNASLSLGEVKAAAPQEYIIEFETSRFPASLQPLTRDSTITLLVWWFVWTIVFTRIVYALLIKPFSVWCMEARFCPAIVEKLMIITMAIVSSAAAFVVSAAQVLVEVQLK